MNTISLSAAEELQNLRVHDAEIVTNDKISPVVGSYSISDSLPNITVASEELLSGATSYQIQDDVVGVLRVDEALAWYRSDSYVQPDSDGPSFRIVDEAHIIQGSIVEPDARTVMGDAALVRADGGTVSVEASNSLQGLSFFVADQSSYAIEDDAVSLMSTGTADALASLNLAGISSITLVDADVADIANADDGASLNAIASGLTNGASISFLVQDSATALAANAMGLNLADNVSVGADGDNELTVGEADALNGITNYDHAGGYTISDDAAAVSGSSVEILGDSDSVTVTGLLMLPRA